MSATSSGKGKPQPSGARRIKHGLRLRSRDVPQPGNWVARRWLSLLDHAIDPVQRQEGLAYARSGQTISLEVHGGVIEARVQGRAPKPYTVQLRLDALDEAQWHEVVLAMTAEAIYAAMLPAGEVPEALDNLFTSMGQALLPARAEALAVQCTCDLKVPCKHAAAVGFLLAERLSEKPSQVFDLYGLSDERIVERLRQARAVRAHGSAKSLDVASGLLGSALALPESEIQPQPLETCLDDFWRCGPQLAELEQAPPPQHVAHALLRRLGPSPMKGKFPMVGLLASIYDSVAEAAIRVRDQAERLTGEDGGSTDPS